MPIIMVHGFHRLSSFWSGPKGTKRPPKPTDFGLPFIHPGFLVGRAHFNARRHPGLSTGNYMRLPGATVVFHPRKNTAHRLPP